MAKFERYLTYRIDVLSTGAIRMANAIYQETCGLSVRELRILRLVDDRPGITFSALADETKFERSVTSRLLTSLLDQRLIKRQADPEDGRQFRLFPSKEGKNRRNHASIIGEALERHLLKPLSDAQRECLIESLEILTDWVYGDAESQLMSVSVPAAKRPKR